VTLPKIEQRLAALEANYEGLVPMLVAKLMEVVNTTVLPMLTKEVARPTYLTLALFQALIDQRALTAADVLAAFERLLAEEIAKQTAMADLVRDLMVDWRRDHGGTGERRDT
jgi:hypothetical protein